MSLLTKEQQAKVERARAGVQCKLSQWTPAVDIFDLLAIIDDLQARAPKVLETEQAEKAMKDDAARLLSRRQYTEAQMRTAFEQQCDKGKSLESFVTPDGKFVSGLSVYAKHGWMACARFLGALKAEP